MNSPRIETFGRFFAAGCPQFGDPQELCPGFSWDRLKEQKRESPIYSSYSFEIGLKVYGGHRPDDGGQFYCMAAVPLESAPSNIPLGYFVAEIPENQYAVFDIPALDALALSFDYIYNQWLPSSGYMACCGYDFEKFANAPESDIQIWVPVSEKTG